MPMYKQDDLYKVKVALHKDYFLLCLFDYTHLNYVKIYLKSHAVFPLLFDNQN